MKTILKTQFKTHKIMRKTGEVQKEEGSVHRSGHVGVELGGLAVAALLFFQF